MSSPRVLLSCGFQSKSHGEYDTGEIPSPNALPRKRSIPERADSDQEFTTRVLAETDAMNRARCEGCGALLVDVEHGVVCVRVRQIGGTVQDKPNLVRACLAWDTLWTGVHAR